MNAKGIYFVTISIMLITVTAIWNDEVSAETVSAKNSEPKEGLQVGALAT